MNGMKINRRISMYDVRKMCIRYGYCDCMDNAQYDRMLTRIESGGRRDDVVYNVAIDIVAYSSEFDGLTGQDEKDAIESVVFELINSCATYFVEIR